MEKVVLLEDVFHKPFNLLLNRCQIRFFTQFFINFIFLFHKLCFVLIGILLI